MSTSSKLSTMIARVVAVVRSRFTVRTPTAQEYWGDAGTTVGWWRAL